ncbi:hypothetical protein PR202_gb23034 [Eleusine coracana subsp. coracana]|uniref:Transcription factor n=1 Tax=Eleusine coracana subsp. coracana TaxID=191504 RepID=A0AAV5FFA0_ELECO|nr:hypothetical protein PR202_gb23034 [Eleusine coracana subsp. coracana]
MDELLSSPYSFSPPSPASFFSHHPVIEFASCEVPEQWLLGDVVVAKNEEEPSVVTAAAPAAQQRPPGKRRGRKPGPRLDAGPNAAVSHVEAERQRRDKLNRRFCDLRAAVPTVSRMDKASLLADAAAYITELRARVARLEAEAKRAAAARREPAVADAAVVDEAVEVRMVGPDAAAVRATSAAPHAAARLMGALRALDLRVQHACVSRVNGVTVQDVVVDVPAEVHDEDALRKSLLQMLLQDSTTVCT